MTFEMKEKEYLNFFANTLLGYSRAVKRQIRDELENKELITFEEPLPLLENSNAIYFENKSVDKIVSRVAKNNKLLYFFEYWEFIKSYKYSVPFFYEGDISNLLNSLGSDTLKRYIYSPEFTAPYILGVKINEITPSYYCQDNYHFLKFVMQRSYLDQESMDIVNYRYPIIIAFNSEFNFFDIRFDQFKNERSNDYQSQFSAIIDSCLEWIKQHLNIKIYLTDPRNAIQNVKEDNSGRVKIYKQMMELSSGGKAELTASQNQDYVLPFIGEIKEIIEENEDLFNSNSEIKQLLIDYLDQKEATASYPYIYIKWLDAIETESYIVKVVFNYYCRKYTQLQHISGICRNLRMERMNNAIEYLCENGSFIRGEEL